MAGAIVSASVGVLNPLLTKLSSLIEGEYKLLKSVKKDIIFLRNELSSISVLLEHLSNKEDKLDGPTMEWRNNMLELAYDIEDCIDLFIHKLSCGDANANFVRKIGSKIKKLWGKHQITECIQELKNRVMEEDQRRKRYQIDDFISEPSMVEIDPRLLALYEEVERLVGIDGPREKIVKWIMHKDWSSEQRKVVSIVGGKLNPKSAREPYNGVERQGGLVELNGGRPAIGVSSATAGKAALGRQRARRPWGDGGRGGLDATTGAAALMRRRARRPCCDDGHGGLGARQPRCNGGALAGCHSPESSAMVAAAIRREMYPEDYQIDRQDLIWRWIAEGFIVEVKNQTQEQVGENYFNELINRSLIQPVSIQYDGNAKYCRVHDIVLDLIISLSTGQNFVAIVDEQQHWSSFKKIRRTWFPSNGTDNRIVKKITNNCSQVRSLLFFENPKPKQIPQFKKCHALRLKYLKVFGVNVTELPKDIGRLQQLETLTIHAGDVDEINIPSSVCRLQKLQRLNFNYPMRLPDEIGVLQSFGGDVARFQRYKEAFYFTLNELVACIGCCLNLELCPKLQRLCFSLYAREAASNLGLEQSYVHLSSLQHLTFYLCCTNATITDVKAVEAAIRNVISIHTRRPTLVLRRYLQDRMVKEDEEEQLKDSTDGCGVEEHHIQ
uniref:Uncharacterized protein n=1 Tax=Oryza glaberrima TaxID=4538 RepID=I1R5G3_ORYGL